jgi:autotransporter strand-loop-strand O-heptosyltransferase
VRFRLEPWQQDERVLAHDYCAEGREVLIRFPVDTLDDVLGWFPYAVKFKEHHGCRLTCAISRKPIALFRDEYCDITFMTEEEANGVLLRDLHDRGLFQGRRGVRAQGLRAVRILDGRAAPRSRLHRPDRDATAHGHSRPQPSVAEPYVCIAVQNTLQAKCWNNPTGWR